MFNRKKIYLPLGSLCVANNIIIVLEFCITIAGMESRAPPLNTVQQVHLASVTV